MAAPDPESEALIRKLHRELNGLTRRSRNQPQAEPRRVVPDRKGHDSITPSEDASDKGLNSRPASEGDQPSADHGKHKAKGECTVAHEFKAVMQTRLNEPKWWKCKYRWQSVAHTIPNAWCACRCT